MSRTARGILFWGIHFADPANGDEDQPDLGDRVGQYLQTRRDAEVPAPAVDFDSERARVDTRYAAAWDDWWRRRLECQRSQCDLGHAGSSDDDGQLYVYVEASERRAEWDEMVPVTSLEVAPEWEANLRAFCTAVGIPWTDPGWFLTSSYG